MTVVSSNVSISPIEIAINHPFLKSDIMAGLYFKMFCSYVLLLKGWKKSPRVNIRLAECWCETQSKQTRATAYMLCAGSVLLAILNGRYIYMLFNMLKLGSLIIYLACKRMIAVHFSLKNSGQVIKGEKKCNLIEVGLKQVNIKSLMCNLNGMYTTEHRAYRVCFLNMEVA